ncbi:hypothetical protein ANN_25043 [Periplaneta americana]|uniref:Uncharacterized protein n=1 Tax=Periplaneta americana TaxID=6978 RepID=A0ABQ8S095_PERAM|nr:hypothetical protein ANN_25043 [Periplaneta americana]
MVRFGASSLASTVKRHNCVYWTSENPHIYQEKAVNLPGLNVWCNLSPGLIVLFFFEGTFTGASVSLRCYSALDISHTNVFGYKLLFEFVRENASTNVKTVSTGIGESWVVSDIRNLWPPRSPDLTTPDFFLWGYLKDKVYATRPQTLDDLKHNITQEIQDIDNSPPTSGQ